MAPTTTILSPALKATFSKHAADLAATGDEKVAVNKAVARVVENQHSEATVRGFTVVQDEPESVAGTGLGPTPTDYFVTSVALCENVVFARTAAMHDLDLQALETTVTGDWDLKGLYEIAGADSRFRNVRVETRVKTTSPIERVVEVARLTHRRCPVHQTLARATNLSFRLFVNDMEATL